ncbi:hypothetical protein NKH18_51040 [Streptomyces sp. M10(2022)]
MARDTAGVGPALSAGHSVRPLQRDSLPTSASGTGVRIGSGSDLRRGLLDRWLKAGAFDWLCRILLAELNAVGELDRSWTWGWFPHPRGIGAPDLRPSRHSAEGHYDRGERHRRHTGPGRRYPAGRRGRPRRRPEALLGDKGYDSNAHRDQLRYGRILPVISRNGSPNIKGNWQAPATARSLPTWRADEADWRHAAGLRLTISATLPKGALGRGIE